jgi:hypothetical protein
VRWCAAAQLHEAVGGPCAGARTTNVGSVNALVTITAESTHNGATLICQRGSLAHGPHAQAETRVHAHTLCCARASPQQRPPLIPRHAGVHRQQGRNRRRGAHVQRLEVLVAVMLARERRAPEGAAADGCTELAAALATLPSGLLEMVAEAVAALGHADA